METIRVVITCIGCRARYNELLERRVACSSEGGGGLALKFLTAMLLCVVPFALDFKVRG